MKICGDAARELLLPVKDLPLIRRDARVDKYGVSASRFSAAPVPLRAVYVLVPSERPQIEFKTLSNTRKMQMMLYRTNGMPFMDGLGLRADHFQLVTLISTKISVKALYRPRSGGDFHAVADAIESDLG